MCALLTSVAESEQSVRRPPSCKPSLLWSLKDGVMKKPFTLISTRILLRPSLQKLQEVVTEIEIKLYSAEGERDLVVA
jgi:hypothetical protein